MSNEYQTPAPDGGNGGNGREASVSPEGVEGKPPRSLADGGASLRLAGGFPGFLEEFEGTYRAASELARLGVPVFGCVPDGKIPATRHGVKDATTDTALVREWWGAREGGEHSPMNLAVPTGRASGLWVLDLDGRKGLETLELLEREHGALPETVRVETPSGGVHFYFRWPRDLEVRCKARVLPGVDVRGEGGYVLVPPSVVAGRRYRWLHLGAIAEAPKWLLELVVRDRSAEVVATNHPSAQKWREGERNNRRFREGCAVRARGHSREGIEAALLVLNEERCDPPLDEQEVRKVAQSAARYQPEREPVGGPSEPPGRVLEVVSAESVSPRPVEWLWEGRIPYGDLTLLVGDPGVGKSLLTCWLAARVTGEGGYALLVSAEDDPARAIRPRLEAAGADLRSVGILQARVDGAEDGITLPADVDRIAEAVRERGAHLLVVDPLGAHLEESVNSWRDQSVRRALAPLARMAQTTGCAVVVVAHLNKLRGVNATYRVGGSIGIPAAARSVLLLGRDPDEPDGDQRVLAHAKSNLAPLAASLALRVVAPTADSAQPRLEVVGEVDHSADDLLNEQSLEPTARDDAKEFLTEALKDGPRPVKDILREAREAGVCEITLRRAAKSLGVTSRRVVPPGSSRGGGRWEWSLPDAGDPEVVDQDGHDKDGHPHISDVIIFNSPHQDWDSGRLRVKDDHPADSDHLDHLEQGDPAPRPAHRTNLRACAVHVDPSAPDNGFRPGCRYCAETTERAAAGGGAR